MPARSALRSGEEGKGTPDVSLATLDDGGGRRCGTRQIVIPILLLLAICMLVMLTALSISAIYYDMAEADKSRRSMEEAFANAERALASTTLDYAAWGEAVDHLVDMTDMEWADRNIGVYLGAIHQITASLVMSHEGKVVYASVNGKSLPDPDKWGPIPPAMQRMVRQAQAAPPGRPVAITGVVSVNGGLFLTAVSDIRREDGGASVPNGKVMVFMKTLDRPAVLAMIRPLLEEVDILTMRPPAGIFRLDFPLREALAPTDAPPVAWLSWSAPMPALGFLMKLSWFLVPLLLLLLGGAFAVLQRVQRNVMQDMVDVSSLHRLRTRAQVMAQSVPDLLCLLRNGRVELINPAGCALFDVADAGQLQGRSFVDLVAPVGRVAFQRLLHPEATAAGGPVQWHHLELLSQHGATIPVELCLRPITKMGDDEMILFARDRRGELARRAQVHAAEARAIVADRAKVHFLANISHELRTPLNAIIGFSAILRDELLGHLGAPQYRDYAVDIHDGGVYLLRLVNDLLDIARLDAGELELREGWVDVGTLLDRVERLTAQKAADRGIRVVVRAMQNGVRLLGDEVRLKQTLVNLIGNAIIYTEGAGEVQVSAGLEPGSGDLIFKVADKGIGMSMEAMRIAVEPFAQVDTGLARRQAGAGLGLPLAKGYTEAHGGRLTLQSSPGRGTTVTVRLPASRVQQPLTAPP
ncbi:ATP-binding protein [Niveispirillum sp. BGYR6]|uniref:sensor histidine kinase n=1 Tax=Niveispirillum sp. BGYR6 TaxID=2971249 RepID=UPI0022B9480B|nr:ATP-binding protein [Niveispirillum sp. BGYR6]MDG5493597.1 ATP-binding protein [Niveispirillum sp. BGYR6]